MKDHTELVALVDNGSARRLWLLYNALHCHPFDQAVELARAAEGFVMGELLPGEKVAPEGLSEVEGLGVSEQQSTREFLSEIVPGIDPLPDTKAKKRPGLELTAEQRDLLITRLAEGAKNAQLATQFSLSPKQVQGVRIGCAREIAKRREQTGASARPSESDFTFSIEEVVRYLRQQDDVVVAQENGEFLVNGRFHMAVSDLVGRANRMRSRQRKPVFELPGEALAPSKKPARTNGHPLFWGEAAVAARSEGLNPKT